MLGAQDTIKNGHFQAKNSVQFNSKFEIDWLFQAKMSWPTSGYSGQAISRNIKVL